VGLRDSGEEDSSVIVYVVLQNTWDGLIFDSVWTTPAAARERIESKGFKEDWQGYTVPIIEPVEVDRPRE